MRATRLVTAMAAWLLLPGLLAGQEGGQRCELRLDHADRGTALGQNNYFAAGQTVVADFRKHLFGHLQKLTVSFFARRRTGELLSRLMSDVTVIPSSRKLPSTESNNS